jgi:hypothetical protein
MGMATGVDSTFAPVKAESMVLKSVEGDGPGSLRRPRPYFPKIKLIFPSALPVKVESIAQRVKLRSETTASPCLAVDRRRQAWTLPSLGVCHDCDRGLCLQGEAPNHELCLH